MAFNIEEISLTVKNFADEVRNIFPVAKVFLYGSYAKGCATDYSDVYICFFLCNYGDKDWFDIMKMILKLSYKYDIAIEPNVFELSDLENDNPFVKEVLHTGIEIL
jgi:predicted nucleotidyltransferase